VAVNGREWGLLALNDMQFAGRESRTTRWRVTYMTGTDQPDATPDITGGGAGPGKLNK